MRVALLLLTMCSANALAAHGEQYPVQVLAAIFQLLDIAWNYLFFNQPDIYYLVNQSLEKLMLAGGVTLLKLQILKQMFIHEQVISELRINLALLGVVDTLKIVLNTVHDLAEMHDSINHVSIQAILQVLGLNYHDQVNLAG